VPEKMIFVAVDQLDGQELADFLASVPPSELAMPIPAAIITGVSQLPVVINQ